MFAHLYAIDNPREFARYGEHFWGLTASDGPGPVKMVVSGREREFFEYCARGVPDGPEDGAIAPRVVSSQLLQLRSTCLHARRTGSDT